MAGRGGVPHEEGQDGGRGIEAEEEEEHRHAMLSDIDSVASDDSSDEDYTVGGSSSARSHSHGSHTRAHRPAQSAHQPARSVHHPASRMKKNTIEISSYDDDDQSQAPTGAATLTATLGDLPVAAAAVPAAAALAGSEAPLSPVVKKVHKAKAGPKPAQADRVDPNPFVAAATAPTAPDDTPEAKPEMELQPGGLELPKQVVQEFIDTYTERPA